MRRPGDSHGFTTRPIIEWATSWPRGYFDPAIGMLRRYDTIEVWAGGGAGRRFDELVVTQIDPGATPPEGRVTVRPLSEFRHERIRSNRKRRKPANKGDS